MAYRQCNEKDRTFASFKAGQPMPREICGLTGGKAFDLCVATGNFDQCLSGAVQRGNRAGVLGRPFLPRRLYLPGVPGRYAERRRR